MDPPGAARWEAGVAAGAGRFSDYPGANQAHTRGVAVPVFIYRGPTLRIDQSSVRGRFLDTPQWQFDIAATAAFNAKNNDARQGMPPLDYLFGAGPQLIYKGWLTPSGGPTLHFKLRALMSTNFRHVDPRGTSFDPELRWRTFSSLGGSRTALNLSLQPSWATQSLHRYFYQVDPAEATASRPAYSARAGYLGTEAAATWSWRPSNRMSWFVSARVMSLHGSANADSPLLKDKTNYSVGAGLVWTPWHSTGLAAP